MKEEILFQLDIGWQLFEYHCSGLTEEEALWCKASQGLQVRKIDHQWVPDWPDTESYDIGPASIAWIMWHMLYWWKNTLSASQTGKVMKKEDILWPGSVELAIEEMKQCHSQWIEFVQSLSEEELCSDQMCRWPFEGKNMYSLILWLNMELMKNAAEMGNGRFLYAVAEGGNEIGG